MDYEKYIDQIRSVRYQIQHIGEQNQQEEIKKASPYAEKVTSYIRQFDELRLYTSLHLQESHITRPAIIRNIDFDLWVSAEGYTNLELMNKGNAPYAFDSPEGKIEIHHIGQNYDGPFAELTFCEHNENSHILHISKEESWRKDKRKEKAFYKERSDYWKKRAKCDYSVSIHRFNDVQKQLFHAQHDYLEELRKICEVIYSQCEAEDLDYLSDLARSFAMMHRIGSLSMGEFLKNKQDQTRTDIRCPHCFSQDYVLNGTYQTQDDRIQRYKCKQCGKIFSSLQKTLVSGSSFSFRQWIKFIDCLYNGYTIKQIAKSCDISEHTAHENRVRLFYALKLLNDKVKLQGNVVLDETYLPVSYKGNHSKQEDFVMPREANERGGENHQAGISKNLVCIICAVDDCGNSVAKVAGTGNTSAQKLKFVMKEHLTESVVCLYSDKSPAIRKFADICNLQIKQEKLLRKGVKKVENVPYNKDTFIVNRYLQVVNSYHSRLKRFLNRFSGISTKYLSGYLYLFAWKERNREKEPEDAYKELLEILTAPDHYLPVEDIMKNGHIPDALTINKLSRKNQTGNLDRCKEIYRRYAEGETMTSIAASYGCSKQNISMIIQRLRKDGLAYRTKKDIEREQEVADNPFSGIRKDSLTAFERNQKIYAEKQTWKGSADSFNKAMAKKYSISPGRVKNIVSQVRRTNRLKDEIFIFEEPTYQMLKDTYAAIYEDYLEIRHLNPDRSHISIERELGEKYNYGAFNIRRIIELFSRDGVENYLNRSKRIRSNEVHNRDKAIFIDYLKWDGTKHNFLHFAAEKYNLSVTTVSSILVSCMCADPKRANIV